MRMFHSFLMRLLATLAVAMVPQLVGCAVGGPEEGDDEDVVVIDDTAEGAPTVEEQAVASDAEDPGSETDARRRCSDCELLWLACIATEHTDIYCFNERQECEATCW